MLACTEQRERALAQRPQPKMHLGNPCALRSSPNGPSVSAGALRPFLGGDAAWGGQLPSLVESVAHADPWPVGGILLPTRAAWFNGRQPHTGARSARCTANIQISSIILKSRILLSRLKTSKFGLEVDCVRSVSVKRPCRAAAPCTAASSCAACLGRPVRTPHGAEGQIYRQCFML